MEELPPNLRELRHADLWHYYDENAAQARHHEEQRERVTTLMVAIAAALIAFVAEGDVEESDLPVAIMILILGLFGAVMGLKHYERNRMHTAVMRRIRDEIDRSTPDDVPSLTELRRQGRSDHKGEFKPKLVLALDLYVLWASLSLLISVVGSVLLVLSI